MTLLRVMPYLALAMCASAREVTPIEKVITLLEDMKTDVEGEGKAEATAYDKYACFCKKTTEGKSKSIKDGNDNIGVLSADIADKTAEKEEDSSELLTRKQKQEALSKELEETKARCAKEKAEYEAEAADLSKAISSLKKAIKAMKDSKPSLLTMKKEISQTLAMAQAMNMVVAPKHKAIATLLQGTAGVDPNNPEYAYHSNDIIDLLEGLHKDFTAQKTDLDTEYGKAKKACDDLKASLGKQMGANSEAMGTLTKNIQKLAKEIAAHREDLVEAESDLKDDELYLKDLTAGCEARAGDYDQRSSMRSGELEAITSALKILKDEVQPADAVNVRALLMQKIPRTPESAPANASHAVAPAKTKTLPANATLKSISFLQGLSTKGRSASFLARGSSSLEVRRDNALAVLTSEGERLNSLVLTSLAAQAATDPFKKVKGLIQKLIERLLTESRNEATKKGWCDTELGKAEKERGFRFDESMSLAAELTGLNAKKDALTESVETLTEELKELKIALNSTTIERESEKKINMETIATAQKGYKAVTEALLVLKVFYKQAAKASFVQASPVDEDTSGPGFSGAYKGKQSSSNAVFALLETIQSDFDRTVRATTKAEEEAHRDYVDFVQATKSSIGSKTTKKELDEQDLKSTKTAIEMKTADLQNSQDLLDAALKELESLKPTCMDTGMSYEERVQKREDEIKALKKALCMLDEEGVEAECF